MERAPSQTVGEAALKCYQCGKCTAGCPVSGQMDVPPNQLIRFVQLGQTDRAIRAEGIWRCVSCQTCSARCPKSVDCAGVLDALRQLALARGAASPAGARVILFQQAFLDNIRRHGRVDEVGLTVDFKQRVFFRQRSLPVLLEDASLAPELMKRGKFHLRGARVRDHGVVERIFSRTMEAQ